MTQPAIRREGELRCTQKFTRHQREWFAEIQARVADGEPLAVVSADSPHEIYRALDVPYVVVQWWSSVIAAKQRAPAYLERLACAGYPDDSEQYNALPFGELLDEDPAAAPWGGLPRPTILQASVATDGLRPLFEEWAAAAGAEFVALERTVDVRPEIEADWWDKLPRHWDTFLDPARLDVLTDELTGLIRRLESLTGRRFSETRFAEAMALANEQSEYNRATRDLIARTHPAPVSVAETMAATMIPQWHRGSVWGRDAAAALHAEVAERVAAGDGVCAEERLRLMWLGRGLWSSLGLYQHFQREHGAVFVWSMYLGLAADGYLRYPGDHDLLRALAARFVPVGEEIRMPTWARAWHLKEARAHGIDGVVSLGEEDYFSVAALERAGIPVLSMRGDNIDRRTWSEERLIEEIGAFLQERVRPAARRRHDRG